MAAPDASLPPEGSRLPGAGPEKTPGAEINHLSERLEGGSDETSGPAGGPQNATPDAPETTRISDERFIKDLENLKDLRSFLIQEAVSVGTTESGALEFGRLNQLRLASFGGRDPKEEEWIQLERHTRVLFGLLTPPLRRRFLLGAIPGMLAWLPVILAPVALASLILAIISGKTNIWWLGSPGATVLPFYLFWLMSLGAIGAVAFIGMNALSVQEDITFDLTNKRLIILRIALGALFGLVLTLPFGFDQFQDFCQKIVAGTPSSGNAGGSGAGTVTFQAMMLVLPFILGFSTSLVILILNRFVDAVQGFFGQRTRREDGGPPPSPPTAGASPPPPPARI